MDEQNRASSRPTVPRRRKRSKLQIFKETYLPLIIIGVSCILLLIFIIGSIVRGSQRRTIEREEYLAASASEQAIRDQYDQEASLLLQEAALLAAGYDYDNAIAVLESFSGVHADYPEIAEKHAEYNQARNGLIKWEDPSKIINLSFQLLIADPARAFTDDQYADSFSKNFITVHEFSSMLEQLYSHGYVLVGLKDFLSEGVSADGSTIRVVKPILLPAGKKPLMLTQLQVNYNTYMIDGDGDQVADKNGAGFASRLMLDENGAFTCEYVDAEGQTLYGAYDMVPILERFILDHPDFSYRGSKATLALTAYDGLLGYRTNPDAEYYFGTKAYEQDVADAKATVDALRSRGYHIACYTYNNLPYASTSVDDIKSDLQSWKQETESILGAVTTLVYAKESDIATSREVYSGSRYEALKDAGFQVYMGFSLDGHPWASVETEYFRQGRIMVTGANLSSHPEWFSGMFDAGTVTDPARNG